MISTRRIREEIADEIRALRRLISNLRPPVIGERGLAQALREGADSLVSEAAVHVDSGLDVSLAPELESGLYRIAREAFLNVNAHAHARRVDVTLARRDDEIVFSIRDDGRGFDGSEYTRNPAAFLGLSSMDDVARALGGVLRVVSGRGAGTEVRATVPLPSTEDQGSELSQVTSAG
jgi:signal transduction histidine kinase